MEGLSYTLSTYLVRYILNTWMLSKIEWEVNATFLGSNVKMYLHF